ncbi:MAG: hypothetical protein KC457_09605 [Myxococcales bacterium]|nr:hypothetical protein [Myxococcales bacterium]
MNRRALLALLAATLVTTPTACEQDPRGPLDLDAVDEPVEACVIVDHDAPLFVDGQTDIYAFVADAADARSGWALIGYQAPLQVEVELALVRVPDGDEPETPLIPLGVPPFYADEAELRAGLEPGSAWLLLPGSDALSLHAFTIGKGLVASNNLLTNFPGNGGSGCPNVWQRQLLLIEGRPFIFALPDCSSGPALEPELLELSPSDLSFVTSWVLSFDPCFGADDPEQCAQLLGIYLGDITPGASSQLPGAGKVPVAYSYVVYPLDAQQGKIPLTIVAMLELRLGAEGPEARQLTFPPTWNQDPPPPLGEVALTQDGFSTQLHVRSQALPQDEALFRLDTVHDLYAVTTDFVPLSGRGKLIQLATESAMMTVDHEAVLAVPLIDYAHWPQWSENRIDELPGLLRIEPAGLGHLLLRRKDAAPQIIRVRCLDDVAGDENPGAVDLGDPAPLASESNGANADGPAIQWMARPSWQVPALRRAGP